MSKSASTTTGTGCVERDIVALRTGFLLEALRDFAGHVAVRRRSRSRSCNADDLQRCLLSLSTKGDGRPNPAFIDVLLANRDHGISAISQTRLLCIGRYTTSDMLPLPAALFAIIALVSPSERVKDTKDTSSEVPLKPLAASGQGTKFSSDSKWFTKVRIGACGKQHNNVKAEGDT